MSLEDKNEMKDWKDFLPRGTKRRLAIKHGLSTTTVTHALKKDDVLNYPDLIEEARSIAFRAIEMCRKHAKAVKNVTLD